MSKQSRKFPTPALPVVPAYVAFHQLYEAMPEATRFKVMQSIVGRLMDALIAEDEVSQAHHDAMGKAIGKLYDAADAIEEAERAVFRAHAIADRARHAK